MPLFEYICRDCQQPFETLVTRDRQPECPACHGRSLDKQLSVFAVATKSTTSSTSSIRAMPTGGCGTCGDPRGPGACSIN